MRELSGNEEIQNLTSREEDNIVSYGRTPTGDELINDQRRGSFGSSIRSSLRKFSDGASLRRYLFVVDAEKPSDQHDIHDIEYNAVSQSVFRTYSSTS